jgi:hypothetical protein
MIIPKRVKLRTEVIGHFVLIYFRMIGLDVCPSVRCKRVRPSHSFRKLNLVGFLTSSRLGVLSDIANFSCGGSMAGNVQSICKAICSDRKVELRLFLIARRREGLMAPDRVGDNLGG